MTLLAYALLADPDPLQAGGTATLTLIVSNPGRQVVTAESIAVLLPVGTSAKALTPDASGIQSQVPAGWSVSQSGGELTLRPASPGAARVAGGGLSFVFAGIRLNAEPGTVAVTITETASSPAQPAPQPGTATLTLDKFPRQFSLGGLTATPLRVEPGASATLMWSGSPAEYALYYDPGTGPMDVRVGGAGPYVATNLARPAGVAFTLRVAVNVPGQDRPLLLQRQVHVDVAAVAIDAFEASPSTVGPNGLARLSWRTSNAASVTLDPGNLAVPASGVRYVTVAPGSGPFTLTARGSQPRWSAQQQRTVSVDPAIVATGAGYVQVGRNGADGADGGYGRDGERGENGQDVRLAGSLPPLDVSSRPARVLPIRLVGGDGGLGGDGGAGRGGRGANGGRGGNAAVDVTFDETLPPAQYLVQAIAGGRGGPGGRGTLRGGFPGSLDHRWDGYRGEDGVASVAFRDPAELAGAPDGEAAAAWTLHCAPDPLPAGTPGAALTLVGTAAGSTVVVTLPAGAGADALTGDPAGIAATAPAGWTVAADGGTFAFTAPAATPDAAGVLGANADPVAFTFTGIAVNDVPGTCSVQVDGAQVPLVKFPAGFSVSPLVAAPGRVDAGGAATLLWSGTPGEYELRWDAGAGPVRRAVPSAGSLSVDGLAAPGVVFILAVTLPSGLVLERRTYVEVAG